MAQIPADILLRVRAEQAYKEIQKLEREIGKIDAAEGRIPDALARKYVKLNGILQKREKEVRDAGLAEKVNTRELKKQTAELAKQKKQRDGRATSALVGGGFPLLFGGGPGSILGGVLGGALGGKKFGFELSIGLGALGTVIDRLTASARNLGNAFDSVDDTLKQVKQIGFDVNRATEKRVQLLVEEGRATEAFLLILERTGITAQQVQNLRELDTAFDELQDASAKLFVTIASELTPAIVVITNLITDFIKGITGPEIQRAAANLDPQAFQAAQTEAAQKFGQKFGPAGDIQGYENFLTERAREIVAANSPDIDTSKLEAQHANCRKLRSGSKTRRSLKSRQRFCRRRRLRCCSPTCFCSNAIRSSTS